MKEELVLLFIFLFPIEVLAQKNQVKIGGGLGALPEYYLSSWNTELQYERKVSKKSSVFTALGLMGDSYTMGECYSYRVDAGRWTRCWGFEYQENFLYLDAGFKRRLFKLGGKYEMKAALGASLVQLIYRGPDIVTVYALNIVSKDHIVKSLEKIMFLVGLENSILITDRLSLSLIANYRRGLGDEYYLSTYKITGSVRESGRRFIPYSANVNLQLGYNF